MQPTLCSRCKKNVAVIFITRIENGESHNEGLCLRCARELHIKPVDEMMEKLGISDADLDNLTGDVAEMLGSMGMLGGDADTDSDAPDADTDEDDGKTATFPFLNRLFNQNPPSAPDAETPEQPRQDAAAADKRGSAPRKLKFLTNYCIDLTQRARDGKLDAMIGRAEELERVIQILNRRQKNNPCLIGEPGVGKTAIAEGLAQRIAEGNVPYKLRDKQVYLLDLTALVAGTQFRGQFESRMKGLIEEIRRVGNIILVIDEVHNIVGAGDAEGSMNAANILKPALSRGEIQVIGATTFAEYRKHIEKDAALERRFQPVTVAEPGIDDSVEILKGVRRYYEDFHGVIIPDAMCRLAVVLSERYITDRFLPDKAIDLIDEACSDVNLKNADLIRADEVEKEIGDYASCWPPRRRRAATRMTIRSSSTAMRASPSCAAARCSCRPSLTRCAPRAARSSRRITSRASSSSGRRSRPRASAPMSLSSSPVSATACARTSLGRMRRSIPSAPPSAAIASACRPSASP